MIEKHVKILGISFILFFFLTVLLELPFYKKKKSPREIEVTREIPLDMVSKIIIEKEDKKLELQRINGLWTVLDDRVIRSADEDRIKNTIELFSLLKGKIVGINEKDYVVYKVDEKEGIKIKFFGKKGNNVLDIIVGKQGPDFATNFVRLKDKKEVVLVDKSLRFRVSAVEPSAWRNRKITSFKVDSVLRVEYKTPEERYMLFREGERWYIDSKDIPPAETKIKRYVSMIGNVYCVNYIDTLNVEEYKNRSPYLSISVVLEGNKKQGFRVIEMFDENKYIIYREGDNTTLYALAKNYVENSLKKESNWFIKEIEKEEEKKGEK